MNKYLLLGYDKYKDEDKYEDEDEYEYEDEDEYKEIQENSIENGNYKSLSIIPKKNKHKKYPEETIYFIIIIPILFLIYYFITIEI